MLNGPADHVNSRFMLSVMGYVDRLFEMRENLKYFFDQALGLYFVSLSIL